MNSLQSAFQYSQSTRPDRFPHAELFYTLLSSGFSVILRKSERTCPITDALLPGEDTALIAAFASRESAIKHWFRNPDRFIQDDDEGYILLHPQQGDRYDDDLSSPVVGILCTMSGNPSPTPTLPGLPQPSVSSETDDIAF